MKIQPATSSIKFLDRNPPRLSLSLARKIAWEVYDVTGEFDPLFSERDQNFHIHGENELGHILKISNIDEDSGVIDFQIKALNHIRSVDETLPVPRVIKTVAGEYFTRIRDEENRSHLVHALTFLPGVTPHNFPNSPVYWDHLGRTLGKLDLALRGFSHPKSHHALLWDISRCADLRPFAKHLSDKTLRRNVESILDTMIADVLPQFKTLRHQVIHSDIHAGNTLIDPNNPDRITGLFDFGDMVFAPLVNEVAIAADIDTVPPREILDSLCAIVAGYDDIVPLEEAEIDLIYDLSLARYAITATIIAWRNATAPDPDYRHASEPSIWAFIDNFMSLGRRVVRDRLRAACSFPVYCPIGKSDPESPQNNDLMARRKKVLGSGLTWFYSTPVHVERGRGPWLYDAGGRAFLDAYNNVPVAGHCHPRVVKAVSRQMAALNTNTRYLYHSIIEFSERLVDLLPDPLSVCLFANSGSEANDIAWRIAKFTTGNSGALIMEDAYHGITDAVADLTQNHPSREPAPHVKTLMSPDPYRGPYRFDETGLAEKYAGDVDRAIEEMTKSGMKPAACIVDTAFTSNGIPDVPAGYLKAVVEKVRAAGGLFIADEVQAGFGRLGTAFWGHQIHEVIPDIVTMGKPVGNGFPMGIVVTRPDILGPFAEATGLFSTFGGNPVACAAGLAVLDVIKTENLMENSRLTGEYLRSGLKSLMDRHLLIGDIRGRGLMTGVEMVKNRETKEPATAELVRLLDLLRDNGVLAGSDGRFGNVLKIRPPLVFSREHANILVDALDKSLTELVQEA